MKLKTYFNAALLCLAAGLLAACADDIIREFGIRKLLKKLVISLLFCNFIVVNQ